MEDRRPAGTASNRLWYGLGAVAILILLGTCRHAPLGVPAADDYDYLYWLSFHRPFDFFDSMGSLFYWRPLGRQIYYAALRPAFFAAPWVVALAHGLILWAMYVVIFRVARRAMAPPAAAAAAVFPLLSEPMRTLFVWPTGGEYLLAMLASALAIHEALARRWWTAGVAALAGLLSHEAAALTLPAMALISWKRGDTWRGLATAAAVTAIWYAGHVIAESHGTGWIDRGSAAGFSMPKYVEVLGRVLASQLNVEEIQGPARTTILVGYVALGLAGLVLLFRERRRWTPVMGGIGWLLLGAAPLSLLLPNWNAWRSPFPALWLGLACAGLLGRGWLALSFIALRTLALVLAPTASALVSLEPPPSQSGMSFVRVARLQRTAELTREALLARYPTLPAGATIAYWSRLAVTEIALIPPKAPRVWYGDSTITWEWLWRPGGLEARHDAVLSFDPDVPRPAILIEPQTLDLVRAAIGAMDLGRARSADSLLVAALQAQGRNPSGQLAVWTTRNRARIAYQAGAYEQADRMNQAGFELVGPTPEYYGMAALLALRKGDATAAQRLARQALALDPANPLALQAQTELAARAP